MSDEVKAQDLAKDRPSPDRRNWVGAPEAFALDQCAHLLHQAFGEVCYLVGSAIEKRDFRDVDVRMIVSDEKWLALFGKDHTGCMNPFWSLLCTALSEWCSRRTGLKVDFQIQRRGSVSQDDWTKSRVPIGIFLSGVNPDWKDL